MASELVQVIVVRRDLWRTQGWSIGSLVAQGAHAAVAVIMENSSHENVKRYVADIPHMTKHVKEVKGEQQLYNLSKKLHEGEVPHHLWNEQPENFPTCLATIPVPKSTMPKPLKKLQLFRDTAPDPQPQPSARAQQQQQQQLQQEQTVAAQEQRSDS